MRQTRIFGLDLVRAVAILLVLSSHFGGVFAGWTHTHAPDLLSYGGQFGVDLFFVLSGLLIGRVLLRQIAQGPGATGLAGWRVFIVRRWLRTLPAYYACLLVLAVCWAPRLWPHHLLRGLGAAFGLYVPLLQNLFWPMRLPAFIAVSWSLAVEEWFYLGFSALLFPLLRWGERRAYFVVTGLFLVGPPLLRAVTSYPWDSRDHIAIYYLDLIAAGLVVAWCAERHPRRFAQAAWLLPLAIGCLVMVYAGGMDQFDIPARFRRVLDIDFQAITFALFLPAACRWRSARGPVAAAVRVTARLSYALYLTHLSVMLWLDARHMGWTPGAAGLIAHSVVLTVLASIVLHLMVEQPFLRTRPRLPSQTAAQQRLAMPQPVASQPDYASGSDHAGQVASSA